MKNFFQNEQDEGVAALVLGRYKLGLVSFSGEYNERVFQRVEAKSGMHHSGDGSRVLFRIHPRLPCFG